MTDIMMGGIVGLILGMGLQTAGMSLSENIRGMLTLRRRDMLKTLIFALGLGSAVTAVLCWLAVIDVDNLVVRPLNGGVLVGGGLVGLAFGLIGRCPGTALSGMGGGRFWDSFSTVMGGVAGALCFALVYPSLGPVYALIPESANSLFRMTLDKPYLLSGGFLGQGCVGLLLMVLSLCIPAERASADAPAPTSDADEYLPMDANAFPTISDAYVSSAEQAADRDDGAAQDGFRSDAAPVADGHGAGQGAEGVGVSEDGRGESHADAESDIDLPDAGQDADAMGASEDGRGESHADAKSNIDRPDAGQGADAMGASEDGHRESHADAESDADDPDAGRGTEGMGDSADGRGESHADAESNIDRPDAGQGADAMGDSADGRGESHADAESDAGRGAEGMGDSEDGREESHADAESNIDRPDAGQGADAMGASEDGHRESHADAEADADLPDAGRGAESMGASEDGHRESHADAEADADRPDAGLDVDAMSDSADGRGESHADAESDADDPDAAPEHVLPASVGEATFVALLPGEEALVIDTAAPEDANLSAEAPLSEPAAEDARPISDAPVEDVPADISDSDPAPDDDALTRVAGAIQQLPPAQAIALPAEAQVIPRKKKKK